MRLRASLTLLALLSSTTGCTTTYSIPRSELSRLDGWKDDGNTLLEDVGASLRGERKDVRQLHDDEGRPHKFNADTPLILVRTRGEELESKYLQVDVDSLQFRGVPVERPGRPVAVALGEVERAAVREFSWGKTLLLSGGIALGVLGSLVAVGLAVDGDGSSGGGGFDD
ncbi:hypothetical protein [Myxococcus sp. RHSTA-1-4]|uniref:hypothetical protein n=1 Tax=Myxococcus sp. RHSTA-1-4 TaxID=2874601 RepID=UPI001CBDD738|nr:hypothetical protein [Myxococcus sp. RHSTA-1-4]MBZ4419399.1 hypothetical protein [Myxococcus sp. RHSTA-1-4]